MKPNIVFLDRDGIINVRLVDDYVKSWKEFKFLPNVFDSIKLLNKNGFEVIVISNQGGISKGLFSFEELMKIDKKMCQEIVKNSGRILKSFYCPHQDIDKCSCRKPNSGLLFQAKKEFDIDLKKSWMIGDSERDVLAGKGAGCRNILVTDDLDVKTEADYTAGDLFSAVGVIMAHG